MNIYTFSFTLPGSTEATTTEVRGRNETEAKKNFKASDYGKLAPLSSVETTLLRENVMATKQEERDTLEAIRQMVAELGEGSYIATAFEGMFADAESNIENDFGDSMKRRWESAEEKLSVAQEKIAELEKNYSEGYVEWSEAAAADKETIKELQGRTLSPDDLCDISQLLTGKVLELEQEVNNAAERIVESADQPGSAAFQNAVNDHRAAKADLGRYTALLVRVNAIKSEG